MFQNILEVMPTVVFKEPHHGVGVKEEPPASCFGHTCLEIILEVWDGGTQLYRQQHKMGGGDVLNTEP